MREKHFFVTNICLQIGTYTKRSAYCINHMFTLPIEAGLKKLKTDETSVSSQRIHIYMIQSNCYSAKCNFKTAHNLHNMQSLRNDLLPVVLPTTTFIEFLLLPSQSNPCTSSSAWEND